MARCTYHRTIPLGPAAATSDPRSRHPSSGGVVAPHIDLRCAAEALPHRTSCSAHGELRLVGPPFEEAFQAATTTSGEGCVVWRALVDWTAWQRGRTAAEWFAPGTGRPTFWHDELGLYVDLGAWLFLERYGRLRPSGSVQRCGTPGCVEPAHSEAPVRRADRRRVDVASQLDRRFGWGAA